jgi:hypothetical protein
MEARVDVRKLQLLNDRIAQTLDALNQVRMSVYGLGHSPMQNQYGQQFGQPFAQQFGQPFGQQGGYQGYGVNPFTQGGIPGGFGGLQGGFQGGFQPGFGLQHSPFIPGQQNVQGINPVLTGIGGLAHSNPDLLELRVNEIRASDPTRITQTFPYVTTPSWQGTGLW